jgi:hypothetical protein
MPIPPESRARLLIATKEAAAAFVEDMAHIRELRAHEGKLPGQIRLLSGVLRRLLVDNDLRSIAPPRIGPLSICAPDNGGIYRAARKQPVFMFASGGVTVFQCNFRAIVGGVGCEFVHEKDYDQSKTVHIGIDGFLNQNVLALNNEWLSRRHVVKYVANVASGVHSSSPQSNEEKLLSRLRAGFKFQSHEAGGAKIGVNGAAFSNIDSQVPFRWSPNEVDIVLIELLAAAHFLSISPDIQKLETLITSEFGSER